MDVQSAAKAAKSAITRQSNLARREINEKFDHLIQEADERAVVARKDLHEWKRWYRANVTHRSR